MENLNLNAEAAQTVAAGDEVLSLSIYPAYGASPYLDANSHQVEMEAMLTIRRADGSICQQVPDSVIYYTNDTGISVSGNKVIVGSLGNVSDRFFYVSAIVPNGGHTTQVRFYQYNNLQFAKIGTQVQPSLSGRIYEPGVYECCVCDKNGNKFGAAASVPSITVVSGSISIIGGNKIFIDKDTNAEIRIEAIYPGRPVAFLQVAGKN